MIEGSNTSADQLLLNRRQFIGRTVAVGAVLGVPLTPVTAAEATAQGFIQTVLGPIPPEKLGATLVHEHVLCDFIGASETGRHRWQVDEVVRVMRPHLEQLKQRKFDVFIDCTPAYIGRDPRVLKQLAEQTGLHIVTNTGYYGGAGDKFVPKHAYEETADQLADRWVREWERGIEGTGVRPGFIKTGVDEAKGDPPTLSEIDAKLVRAAARASKQSGLSVTCHTGGGPAGLAAAKLFIAEGGVPARFVVAHSDGHGIQINQQVAELGAWVSFDGISRRPLEQHLKLVAAMLKRHANRLLLSHDNGWFEVGKPNGGKVRDFNYLADTFLPALRKTGVTDKTIEMLTVSNPANVLAIAKRA